VDYVAKRGEQTEKNQYRSRRDGVYRNHGSSNSGNDLKLNMVADTNDYSDDDQEDEAMIYFQHCDQAADFDYDLIEESEPVQQKDQLKELLHQVNYSEATKQVCTNMLLYNSCKFLDDPKHTDRYTHDKKSIEDKRVSMMSQWKDMLPAEKKPENPSTQVRFLKR
jgi:hypothetical protein